MQMHNDTPATVVPATEGHPGFRIEWPLTITAKAMRGAAPDLERGAPTLADAATALREWISAHALGASDIRMTGDRGFGVVTIGGKVVAHVSYNGRVWGMDGTEFTGAQLTAATVVA